MSYGKKEVKFILFILSSRQIIIENPTILYQPVNSASFVIRELIEYLLIFGS